MKEYTWTSDNEGSYKTVYASFFSILYLKNMDQMKYDSFIKKMAEDFATGQENIYPIHTNSLIIYMFYKAINLKKNLQNHLHHKKKVHKCKQHHMSKLFVGSTQVPFIMCTLEIPQKISAQDLALNFCLSFTFEPFLKL